MNHPAPGPLARQVADTCRDLVAQTGLPIAAHLPEDQILQTFRAQGGTFRDRVYTPATTTWTFVTQVLDPDHSCRQAVQRLSAYRVAGGQRPRGDTGAYCKARSRLPEGLLPGLTRQTGRGLSDKAEDRWLWKGRRVRVVDGTGLSMPDTPENREGYPQPKKIKAGVGFPLMRLVVVFCLSVGTVLDAAMAQHRGKGTGEVSLFRGLDDLLDPGDVLMGDRIYSNYWEVARALARGADVVLRQHPRRRAVDFGPARHGPHGRRVGWVRPPRPSWMSAEEYATYPGWVHLRAVRVAVRQRGFRARRYVLVTTLLDVTTCTSNDLAELYRRRWQAELNLRSLKAVLQMDVLRGKSPDIVRKEVWAHLLVYNLVRALMAKAAALAGVRPDELSFAGALQAANAFLPHLRTARTEEEASRLWAALLAAIGEEQVGDRPDRVEPRAVKRRPKNYPKLKVPRAEARERLMEDATRKGKKR